MLRVMYPLILEGRAKADIPPKYPWMPGNSPKNESTLNRVSATGAMAMGENKRKTQKGYCKTYSPAYSTKGPPAKPVVLDRMPVHYTTTLPKTGA